MERTAKLYADWVKQQVEAQAMAIEPSYPTERDEARLWEHKVLLMDAFMARAARERAAFVEKLVAMGPIPTLGFEREVDAPVLADFSVDPWCRLARFCFVAGGARALGVQFVETTWVPGDLAAQPALA